MICKGISLPVLFTYLICLLSIPALYSDIVINEVCYDPISSDDYHEWIEFFNNGTEDVDMEDWQLYSGGSDFSATYTFPFFILRPQHYLLLAEEDFSNAHLWSNITLQNGGAESDGIRLTSPDSSYTDTVLYDSPNTNQLPDDIHDIGTELCPDVPEGHSLARLHNGVDTNTSADWFDCSSPTPGSANLIPINLSIGIPIIEIIEFNIKINTPIHNLSTTSVYNSKEYLEIKLDNEIYSSIQIPDIIAQDSIMIDITIHCTIPGLHKVSLNLNVSNDINPVDNLWITSIFVGEISLILNELLYSPSPDNQEWIELYNRGNADLSLFNLHLRDEAQNEVTFNLDIPAQGYKVLCTDSLDFVHNYPNCPGLSIVKLSHWVTLNNDEETIWLTDDADKTLDSLHYIGSTQAYNRSLERRSTGLSFPIWDICMLAEGGTPGLPNSIVIPEALVYIDSVQIMAENDSLIHKVQFHKDESVSDIHLICLQFDSSTGLGESIIDTYLSLTDDSVFVFKQAIPGIGYHAFQYKIECEYKTIVPLTSGSFISDVAPTSGGSSPSEYWSYYNSNSLPFVVNEIMYDPLTGMPEWLEIRRNADLPKYPQLRIHITADSVTWQPDDSQFFVIVHDEQDAESLCEQYSINPEQIISGLPSLSNSGESIFIEDAFNNRWEEFAYVPDWSKDKGISIERIQPALLPGSDNWSPCLAAIGGTPGQENSVFIQQMPTSTNVRIQPNPFFPKRQETCEIRYSFSRPISRVSCKVYDLKGRLVRILADQSLVSAEGSFLWDGKNQSSKNLPIGVYLVYFEAYDQEQRNAFHKQNTVVLGN